MKDYSQVKLEVDLGSSDRCQSNRIAKEQCKTRIREMTSKVNPLLEEDSHELIEGSFDDHLNLNRTSTTPPLNPQQTMEIPCSTTPPPTSPHDH